MVEQNNEVMLRCKRCGSEWPASDMRLDKNGKDMLCRKCNEQQENRERTMKNVKLY